MDCSSTNFTLYVTNNDITNPTTGPSLIDLKFRETIAAPDALAIGYCSVDFSGFPTTAGLYFINCDMIGASGEIMVGNNRRPSILALNGGAYPGGFMSEYHFADLVFKIARKSDEVLSGVQFWFTDITGNMVRFDNSKTFCLSITVLYKKNLQ
jgi:hypothetical protein